MYGNCDRKRFINFNKAGMIFQVKIAHLTYSIPFGFEKDASKMSRTYTEVPIVVPEDIFNYLVESFLKNTETRFTKSYKFVRLAVKWLIF